MREPDCLSSYIKKIESNQNENQVKTFMIITNVCVISCIVKINASNQILVEMIIVKKKRLIRTKKKKSSYYDTNARVILCIVKINGSNYIHRSIIPNLSCPIITSRHFFLQSSPCMVSFSQHDSDYENNKAFFVSCCLIAQLSKSSLFFFMWKFCTIKWVIFYPYLRF